MLSLEVSLEIAALAQVLAHFSLLFGGFASTIARLRQMSMLWIEVLLKSDALARGFASNRCCRSAASFSQCQHFEMQSPARSDSTKIFEDTSKETFAITVRKNKSLVYCALPSFALLLFAECMDMHGVALVYIYIYICERYFSSLAVGGRTYARVRARA